MDIPENPPEFELLPHTRTRQAIGDRVGRSRSEIPHFDIFAQADVTALVAYRNHLKSEGGSVPTYNDLLIHIVASTLPDFPVLNAWWEPEGVKVFKEVHVGFVVHTEEGVLLPTLFNADRKSLEQLSGETRELTEMAQKAQPPEEAEAENQRLCQQLDQQDQQLNELRQQLDHQVQQTDELGRQLANQGQQMGAQDQQLADLRRQLGGVVQSASEALVQVLEEIDALQQHLLSRNQLLTSFRSKLAQATELQIPTDPPRAETPAAGEAISAFKNQ